MSNHNKCRTIMSGKKVYRRRTPGQHAKLLAHLSKFDDSPMMSATDPSKARDMFYDTINVWLDQHYPLRTVTVTSREPPYMTSDLKLLLRRKNRLMRRGWLELFALSHGSMDANSVGSTSPRVLKNCGAA